MQRETLGDLVAFLAVAQEQSFTRAAVRLTEIDAKSFDAGIRPGDQVDHHRVAVPVSPPFLSVPSCGLQPGRQRSIWQTHTTSPSEGPAQSPLPDPATEIARRA